MTKSEINIAAAEARGWKDIQPCTCSCGPYKGAPPGGGDFRHIPNTYSDANAQRDAFLEMTEEQQAVLSCIVSDKCDELDMHYLKAFFTRFGECYLKALGKWRDKFVWVYDIKRTK